MASLIDDRTEVNMDTEALEREVNELRRELDRVRRDYRILELAAEQWECRAKDAEKTLKRRTSPPGEIETMVAEVTNQLVVALEASDLMGESDGEMQILNGELEIPIEGDAVPPLVEVVDHGFRLGWATVRFEHLRNRRTDVFEKCAAAFVAVFRVEAE